MNIIVLGGASFIGKNLIINLAQNKNNKITVVDRSKEFFGDVYKKIPSVNFYESALTMSTSFYEMLHEQDVVFHLLSTTVPTSSNLNIAEEVQENIVISANIFDACVKQGIGRVVFLSSGGAVYGKDVNCPLSENTLTAPITSYGLQKVTIEKLLYLYNYLYGLDYRIVRLSNPYGPYQRPNGVLGAITTFTYKALKDEEIVVYGDGSVIRDFLYIDDAVRGIVNVANSCKHKVYNLGCGYGTSIRQVLDNIAQILDKELKIRYTMGRKVDVPINFLDITRYEREFGKLNVVSLDSGIKYLVDYMKRELL